MGKDFINSVKHSMSVALSIELEISVLWSLTNLSEQSDLRSCEFRLIFFNTNIKCSRPLYYTLLIMQKNLLKENVQWSSFDLELIHLLLCSGFESCLLDHYYCNIIIKSTWWYQERSEVTIAIFTDYSNAFGTIDFSILIK